MKGLQAYHWVAIIQRAFGALLVLGFLGRLRQYLWNNVFQAINDFSIPRVIFRDQVTAERYHWRTNDDGSSEGVSQKGQHIARLNFVQRCVHFPNNIRVRSWMDRFHGLERSANQEA